MNWRQRAQCRNVAVEVFFGRDPEHPPERIVKLCAMCPVRTECLDEAIEDEDLEFGYRGGLTPRYRRRENRRRIEVERRARLYPLTKEGAS